MRPRTTVVAGVAMMVLTSVLGIPSPASAATATEVLSPAEGATVAGEVEIEIASAAPFVRVWFGGLSSRGVEVVAGRATVRLPTWGLVGGTRITVLDCDQGPIPPAPPVPPYVGGPIQPEPDPLDYLDCDPPSSPVRNVTVDNPAPELVLPGPGAPTVGRLFTMSATAGGGSVRFLIDGGTKATVKGSSPFTARVDAVKLRPGRHTLRAAQCSALVDACDWSDTTPTREFVVPRLLSVGAPSDSRISPNGDGRQDSTRIPFVINSLSSVKVRVVDAAGRTILGPRWIGSLPTGPREWTWSGRSGGGDRLPSGQYTVEVAGGSSAGLVSRVGVIVDQVRPVLRGVTMGPDPFYPRPDSGWCLGTAAVQVQMTTLCQGYKDTVIGQGRTEERVRSRLRVWRFGRELRNPYLSCCGLWNTRPSALFGREDLPAGYYDVRLEVEDTAGNRTMSKAFKIYASSRVFKPPAS